MKKMLSILAVCTLSATTATSVVACSDDSNTFRILFVPTSGDPVQTSKAASLLPALLEAKMKEVSTSHGRTWNKKVKVTVSENQGVAGTSLKNGQAALGFLPTGTYTGNRGTLQADGTYSDLGNLVSASRTAIIPETTYSVFQTDGKYDVNKGADEMSLDESIGLVNNYNQLTPGWSDAHYSDPSYDYNQELLNKDGYTTNYYRSFTYANIETYNKIFNDTDGDGSVSTEEYKTNYINVLLDTDVVVALSQGKTSSAGLLYPLAWMKNSLGMTDDQLHQVFNKRKPVESTPELVGLLANGERDMVSGFGDIRANGLTANNVRRDLWKNTRIVAAAGSIFNDGIAYSRKVISDANELADLREAFEALVIEHQEIFSLYSHATYSSPKNMEEEAALDELMTKSGAKVEEISALIKNW